jgi:hypothetical protein
LTEDDFKVWDDYIDKLWETIRWELKIQGDLT